MVTLYHRRRAATPKKHTVLLVEPKCNDFDPSNYRDRPKLFRVITSMTYDTLGEADSKRFRFNRTAIDQGSVGHRWTVKGAAQ